MKTIFLSLTLILLLGGCGEKKEKEQTSESTAVATASGIEVSKNVDAYKEKVKAQAVDKNKEKSFYYDYQTEEKTEKKAEETKRRTTLDANIRVRSPYESVEIGMLVDRLSKEFIVKCSACHNDYANGVIGPSLLDKDAKFIFEKIRKFKTDPNANVLMTELVKQMSDAEIEKLANEIENFNTKINEMRK